MDEIVKLLDENLEYISHEIVKDIVYITVKSTREEVSCPYCNYPSKSVHSYYDRSFQDLPIQGKKVIIIIKNRKMFCKNAKCSHKTFAEHFEFLSHKSKKTKRLEEEIINISLNVSSVAASKYLKTSVADVSKSTICNILKKEEPIIEKSKIEIVCIDDFAIKKRESYGTIMVDIETHRIIDLIESRDSDDVKTWLKTYPNIKVVSRDGSITYKNAISSVYPNAIQVSDRFHILKNLTSYCKDFLKKYFKTNVVVEEKERPIVQVADLSSRNRQLTLSEKIKRAKIFLQDGVNKSNVCRNLNIDIRVLNKLLEMNDCECRSSNYLLLE